MGWVFDPQPVWKGGVWTCSTQLWSGLQGSALFRSLREILVKIRIKVLLVGEAAEQPGCVLRVKLDLHWVIFNSLTKC